MALVYPLKNYEPGEYEGPVDTSADQLVAFGFYPQNSASPDLNVGIEREAGTSKLILKTASTNISLRIGGSEYAWLDTTGLLSANKIAAVNNLYSPNLDTASGVALTIGGTNATSLALGKAGVTVNVPGTLQEAGSRVWTAATLAADRSNAQGFLTAQGAPLQSDVNAAPYGFSYWDASAVNRPANYGTLLSWPYVGTSMARGSGAWDFQLSIDTGSPPTLRFRSSINSATWDAWATAWTDKNLTNLSQLTNGPGYITSVAGALGYTPVNKAGDTMTGVLSTTATTTGFTAESWIAPTLINSWQNYGAPYCPARFYKDAVGVVHLEGSIKWGSSAGTAFVLPAGYRPSYALNFAAYSLGADALVVVDSSGNVVPYNVSTSNVNTVVCLDGITFRAEQ